MGTNSKQSSLPAETVEIIDDLIVHARVDLFENTRFKFSENQIASILNEANRRLREAVAKAQALEPEEIRQIWRSIVIDFHQNWYWGFTEHRPDRKIKAGEIKPPKKKPGRAFFRQLVISMLVTKAGLLYFGAYYSSFPGRGYGWGLAATCAFAVISLFSLAWRYRNADL